MQKVIGVYLSGHEQLFQLDEDAYRLLKRYLDHAASRLGDDLDRDEVVHDLEQSIGEKFTNRLSAGQRVITASDVNAVLEEIGSVDTGASQAPRTEAGPTRTETGPTRQAPRTEAGPSGRRQLRRIREGEWIAGVCTGLSAYADIRVDWVRLIFVLLTFATAGGFALVYVVLMFALPVVETRQAYFDLQHG